MLAIVLSALVITTDFGGRIGDYLNAAKTSEPVKIRGFCASACTVYLGAHDVCVARGARLYFHEAHNEDGSKNLLGTLMMQAEYPPRIVAWIRARGGLSDRMLYLSGGEAMRLGVRGCSAKRNAP